MKRLLLLIVVVAVGVTVAALTVPSNAATVDGTAISNQTVNSQLNAITSTDYGCYLNDYSAVVNGGLSPVTGAGSGTWNTRAANFWLTELIGDHLVAGLVAEKGITVGPEAQQLGKESVQQQITSVINQVSQVTGQGCNGDGGSIMAEMPASFAQERYQSQADLLALAAHNAGYGLTADEVERYYNDHQADFQTLCLSAAQVSTQAAATQIENAVKAGTPFSAAATAAGANASSGCVNPDDQGYSTLAPALAGLAPGETTVVTLQQASSTQSAVYGVYQLTSRTQAPLAKSTSAAQNAILQAGSAKSQAQFQAAARRADIWVDPRYGRWSGLRGYILLPVPPVRSSVLNPVANNPALG